MKLEEIYETLKDFAEKEEDLQCKWPCDSDYNVPTWYKIYDALEIIDSIIIVLMKLSTLLLVCATEYLTKQTHEAS